jgi:hypothetical protein
MGTGKAAFLARHQAGQAITVESHGVGHPIRMAGSPVTRASIPRRATPAIGRRHGNAGPGGGPAFCRDGFRSETGSAGQLTRRTNPQMAQVATPVRGSNSRKLGHPLVPQKSLELTEAAVDRRRIRRIADARPVTDDVAERVIMVK